MYRECLASLTRDEMVALIAETRQNWVAEYDYLLARITVPVILVWFSTRSPDYAESYEGVQELFGTFPQLVNASMIAQLRAKAGAYLEYVSQEGLPQTLLDYRTQERANIRMRSDLGGREKRVNDYYPSPEMHAGLAAQLAPLLATF